MPPPSSPSFSRRSFLKNSTLLAGGAVLPMALGAQAQAASQKPLLAYVGTFSSPLKSVKKTQVDLPPGNGKGIYLFEVDRATGAMKPAGIYEHGGSPSCLTINAAGTRIYSANETDRMGEENPGTVSAYSIDPDNGQITLLNTESSGGAGPTFVSLHPSGKYLFVANYFGGSVAVLPILPDGKLGPATDVIQDKGGVGPTVATNAPAGSYAFSGHDQTHAHMIESDPSGRYVLHVDLGMDKIFIWKFDAEKGKLIPNDQPYLAFPPGDGPRHFAFHPNKKWLYSIQEEGSTIVLCDFDVSNGRLTARQTVSSLPPGFAGSNFTSGIRVSPDGRFVYGANRLHDSIACFSVGDNGELTFVGEEWSHGDYPRSFEFHPSGDFLYSCNQRGDNIATFKVNKKTGKLEFAGQYTPVGNPSMIAFLDLAKVG